MGKDFDVEVVQNDRYTTTKIRSHGDEIKNDFHDK